MKTAKIIEALGGQLAVAQMCEVTAQAVWYWMQKEDDGVPKARLQYLKLRRPKVFKALEAEDSADAEAA